MQAVLPALSSALAAIGQSGLLPSNGFQGLGSDAPAAEIAAMVSRIWGNLNPADHAPDTQGIRAFSASDEFLSALRGVSTNTVPHTVFNPYASLTTVGPGERHYQSTLVITGFGALEADGPKSVEWKPIFPDFWDALFNEDIATDPAPSNVLVLS